MHEVFDQVRVLMAKEFQLDPAAIAPDTELTALGVDSLAALEFVFDLEDAFHVTLDSKTDLRGSTVQHVVDAVESALSRQAVIESAT